MSCLDPRSIADDYHYGSIDYEDLILKAPIPITSLDGDTGFMEQVMGKKATHAIRNHRYYIANREHRLATNKELYLLHREEKNANRMLAYRSKKLGLE